MVPAAGDLILGEVEQRLHLSDMHVWLKGGNGILKGESKGCRRALGASIPAYTKRWLGWQQRLAFAHQQSVASPPNARLQSLCITLQAIPERVRPSQARSASSRAPCCSEWP